MIAWLLTLSSADQIAFAAATAILTLVYAGFEDWLGA